MNPAEVEIPLRASMGIAPFHFTNAKMIEPLVGRSIYEEIVATIEAGEIVEIISPYSTAYLYINGERRLDITQPIDLVR